MVDSKAGSSAMLGSRCLLYTGKWPCMVIVDAAYTCTNIKTHEKVFKAIEVSTVIW